MLKLSFLLIAACCSFAQAQTVYLPVQYEYGTGNDRYYYGGSDPAVFARADRSAAVGQIRGVADTKPQVYTDVLPHQPNAAVYGVTASDARDQANNAVPRYYRMRDLVGKLQTDGSITVPPTAGGEIVIKRYVKPLAPTTRPRTIIIIPKPQPASENTVARATNP